MTDYLDRFHVRKEPDFINPLTDENNQQVLNAIVDLQLTPESYKNFKVLYQWLCDIHVMLAVRSTFAKGEVAEWTKGASRVIGEIITAIDTSKTDATMMLRKKHPKAMPQID